jgi:hypothetical protein
VTPDDACRLINEGLIIPPDIRAMEAHPCLHRFDDAIVLETYTRPRLSQHWPDYDVIAPEDVVCKNYVRVGDVETADDLVIRVIDVLVKISEHEIREFVRLADGRAPAHPHTADGIDRWAATHDTRPEDDYQFGLATR